MMYHAEMAFESLILAAGAGRRLGSGDLPKVLVEVAGKPLLVRMARQLQQLGMSRLTVAVGFAADRVREAVGALDLGVPVDFVDNPDFATTNNSVTLLRSADVLERGAVLVEGDVIADDDVLARLLEAPVADGWAVRTPGAIVDGAFLEPDAAGRLRRLTIVRDGAPPPGGLKSTGIVKISPRLGRNLRGWLAEEVERRRDRYFDLVVADHVAEAAIDLVRVDEGRWLEIDSPDDLALARRLFDGAGAGGSPGPSP